MTFDWMRSALLRWMGSQIFYSVLDSLSTDFLSGWRFFGPRSSIAFKSFFLGPNGKPSDIKSRSSSMNNASKSTRCSTNLSTYSPTPANTKNFCTADDHFTKHRPFNAMFSSETGPVVSDVFFPTINTFLCVNRPKKAIRGGRASILFHIVTLNVTADHLSVILLQY